MSREDGRPRGGRQAHARRRFGRDVDSVLMRSDDGSRRFANRWSDARAAAVALAGAGLLTVFSSLSIWASCSTVACNSPLMAIDEMSGIGFGYGGVTAAAGALLTALGVRARLRDGVDRLATLAVQLSLLVIVTVIAFVVDVYVFGDRLLSLWGPPWEMLSVWGAPAFGAILTVCGGMIALLASLRLQRAWGDRLETSAHD